MDHESSRQQPRGGLLGPLPADARIALGPPPRRPPPPAGGVRRDRRGAAARPGGWPGGERRPAPGRPDAPRRGRGRVRTGLGDDRRGGGGFTQSGPPQGVVDLPHAARPRPAGRAAHADVAQPLRHRQPEGQRPGRHAAAERPLSQIRPGPVRRAPGRRDAGPGPVELARRPEPTARGTRTRTSPAS